MSHATVYIVLIGKLAASKSSGKSDTWPATANGRKAPRYLRSLTAKRLKGTMTSRMAFSWTCHPNKKDAKLHSVTEPMKVSQDGCRNDLMRQSCLRLVLLFRDQLTRPTTWKNRVNWKVICGVTLGRTAKELSPTSPLVRLVTAVVSTGMPR